MKKSDGVFFGGLLIVIISFFKQAFQTGFFKDDFFFLNIGRANSVGEFIHFFSPFKSYFYRPIPTEFFYFLINRFHLNQTSIHSLMFLVFFVGLFYLYQNTLKLTHNRLLSRVCLILYGLSFIHVFQLYDPATFIEICLFTFLNLSFYFFLEKHYWRAVGFFVLALMSKETAILFPVLLTGFLILKSRGRFNLKNYRPLLAFYLCAFLFLLIFRFGVKNVVAEIEIYKIQLKPRLILNNLMWYFLWSLGFASFFPDYFVTIFKPPLPQIYKLFTPLQTKLYLIIFLIYLLSWVGTSFIYFLQNPSERKKILAVVFIMLMSFGLFIFPTLPIIHRWMIRLTVPLIFIIFLQAYFITNFLSSKIKLYRYLGIILISLFIIWNYFGIRVHEWSSTFTLETSIVKRSLIYFDKQSSQILKYQYLYFKDPPNLTLVSWNGSEKLKTTYWGQYFFRYYFPQAKITAIYGFENKKIPRNSFIVNPVDILGK